MFSWRLIPRIEIDTASIECSLAHLRLSTSFSRFLLYFSILSRFIWAYRKSIVCMNNLCSKKHNVFISIKQNWDSKSKADRSKVPIIVVLRCTVDLIAMIFELIRLIRVQEYIFFGNALTICPTKYLCKSIQWIAKSVVENYIVILSTTYTQINKYHETPAFSQYTFTRDLYTHKNAIHFFGRLRTQRTAELLASGPFLCWSVPILQMNAWMVKLITWIGNKKLDCKKT